ncbi:MAG: chorismate synthase [Desulfarculaceae bacterium]|jgi:chorismate synthase
MGSIWGRFFRVSTFGESHGPGLGVVVEGVPPGIKLDLDYIQAELDRRRPGSSSLVSARQEPDKVEVLSGLDQGRTLGTPIGMVIRNQDIKGKDYRQLSQVFRPGHADFTYYQKYGTSPQSGGGRASGRETVARVAAGAVARALLEPQGLGFAAYSIAVGEVRAQRVDVEFALSHHLRAADPDLAEAMVAEVLSAREAGDSVGGRLELVISGAPAGLGDPVFEKLDAALGGAMLSIGGVKGVEVGAGFEVCTRLGSQNNDQMDASGFLSNHAGGILGGISTGQPIVLRLAIKPTPSISKKQKTVSMDGREQTIQIKGRHDPCLCPRVAPVAEAMAALVMADAWLAQRALKGSTP